MATITTDAVSALFVTAIIGTTPRMQDGRTTRPWQHDAAGNQRQPVRSDARWFWLEWTGEGDTPEGFMGPLSVDTTVTCSIFVDYGGIPEHRVQIIAADDAHQLRDVLNRLKSSDNGLRFVTLMAPPAFTFASNNTDRNQARCVIRFEVRYMKARG